MTRLEAPNSGPLILARAEGATIAYRREAGRNPPGILFLCGFRSDMSGTKAVRLSEDCQAKDRSCLRFDYFAHGESSGDFRAGTIGRWRDDALAVLDELTEGPQILVGSSMGCWLALLAALARPERVAGLIGIAGAPDFTEDLIWDKMTARQRRQLVEEGEVVHESPYSSAPIPFTRVLIEEARNHLLLRGPIDLSCPIRLLHGMRDPDVPYRTSLRLAECLAGDEVVVELIEDGDHRLSREADLLRLLDTVDELSARARP
jgi:pimeloyl-ACP methyl ester carboxylesterase